MSTYNIRRGPFVLEIRSLSVLPTEDDIIQDSGGSNPVAGVLPRGKYEKSGQELSDQTLS